MSKDLIVLVADVQQEKTLETLLRERHVALGIRPITFDIFRHPRKDPGVFHEAAEFLAPYRPPQYRRALVVFDREWEGAPGEAAEMAEKLRQRLQRRGWQGTDCQVIIADPELEVWVWGSSAVVAEELRVPWESIRMVARQRGYWTDGRLKPEQPKALLEALLRHQRRPRSSALFQALARHVSLVQCRDEAFVLLRETLVEWFSEQV